MAKKVEEVKRDRDLGVVTKQEGSGFFVTNKDEKLPALHGLKVGDKVKLVKGEYVINGGKSDDAEPKEAGNLAEVNAKLKSLETELGEVKTELGEVKTEIANLIEYVNGQDVPPPADEASGD